MITESEIETIINDFLVTSEGKQMVKNASINLIKDATTIEAAKSYGEQMKDILFNHIKPLIKSFKREDIIVGTPEVNVNGELSLSISLEPNGVKRDGLYHDEWGDELENIVLAFTTGIHAKNYAYGNVENKRVRSWKDREGNDFMQKAVNEFNKTVNGAVVATLDDEYKL